MIIGFDYQTREIIREELNELIALRPTFTQTLIYGPMLGKQFRRTRCQILGSLSDGQLDFALLKDGLVPAPPSDSDCLPFMTQIKEAVALPEKYRNVLLFKKEEMDDGTINF